MKIITFSDIVNLNIQPIDCYEWVAESIKNKKYVINPAKISIKPHLREDDGIFYNTMPSVNLKAGCAGVKLVTRYPLRIPSLDSEILLYDLETGKNLALLDGNWITAMRTGAVAAHSIKLLAKSDFSVLGYMGLGNTARASLAVLAQLYPDRPMTVKLKKYKDQHESFMARFADCKNIKFELCDTYTEVVENSCVVVSAVTVFEDDICEDKYFKPGVLVVPIHTRGFTNCDLFFDKVYADDTDHVKGFKNFAKFPKFAEVSDVVNGDAPGRENDGERILAYNIGVSMHDIFYAHKIYELCSESCGEISLEAPEDKFWV